MHNRSADGLIHVAESALTYSDESEGGVLALLQSCRDLTSTSTEMLDKATGWAEKYHTHPARANVIRAFDIPPDAVILEVGAGCGGVSRYLGEIAGALDALEPMEHRARVARERTRDLPNVEVLVGEVGDLPREQSYDLVVVVGVLEYVGHGTENAAPYLTFLKEIRSRLKPGGSLILAIENQLGVKYFVGAPEDHTSRFFDGIEGYPFSEGARTFSRSVILELMSEAGLHGRALCAFPDYKLTRTVMEPNRLSHHLLVGIPHFPSPDWTIPRPRLASERLVWAEVVKGGLAAEFGNSFVVVAGRDGESLLWPVDRSAAYYDVDALAGSAMETLVTAESLSHRFLSPEGIDGVVRNPVITPHLVGVDAVDTLAAAAADMRRPLLEAWRDAVFPGDPSPTVLFLPDGSAVGAPATLIVENLESVAHGLLWLGIRVAMITPPTQWPGAETVGDVVGHFGSLLGFPDSWLAVAIVADAALQERISSSRVDVSAYLSTPLNDTELGPRSYETSVPRALYEFSQNLLADAQVEVERLRALVPKRKH